MKRVLVAGACGRMGERIRHWLDAHEELELGAALEAPGHPQLGEEIAPGVVLGADPGAALAGMDAVIDFTTPEATLALLGAASEAGVPSGMSSDAISTRTGCTSAYTSSSILRT